MDNKNRPTSDFTTTNGHKIVVKEYITGREANEIQASYLKDANVKIVDGKPQVDNFDVTADEKAKRIMMTLMVVSVDGVTENVADLILDLRNEDYEEVIEHLNEKTSKKKAE